jgi:pyruvate/2-oxoglutarate dehydrogenase complex dihydrolipoamide dehydrogenase (E3) component
MLAVFGTRVTLLQRAGQLLPREDADVAGAVADALSDQGVDVRLAAEATAVRREPGHGAVIVTLADGTGSARTTYSCAPAAHPSPQTSTWRRPAWIWTGGASS